MSDVNPIEAAKAPGVFDLNSFLAGVAYPEETVTVFTDAYAVNELIRLKSRRNEIELTLKEKKKSAQRTIAGNQPATNDVEELEEINDKIEKLDKVVAESALKIKLRGISPKALEDLTAKHYTDPQVNYSGKPEEKARDYELIATAIVSIENAEGSVDVTPVGVEKVKQLQGVLLEGEYMRIVYGVSRVAMNGALFDEAVDAPFLSGRTNLAGQQRVRNSA